MARSPPATIGVAGFVLRQHAGRSRRLAVRDGLPRSRGDHADAPEAIDAMTAELGRGRQRVRPCTPPAAGARRVVEESREQLAAALGARPERGRLHRRRHRGRQPRRQGHASGRAARRPAPTPGAGQRRRAPRRARRRSTGWPTHEGAEVELAAGRRARPGRPGALRAAIARDPDEVALVTVMWANNEVGTVQPVAELAAAGARVRRPVPHRRRAGRRAAAGRLRRQRRRTR